MAIVDCPEFWDLIWYIGNDLNESDIPHRTKFAALMDQQFKLEYGKIIDEICVSIFHFAILLPRIN